MVQSSSNTAAATFRDLDCPSYLLHPSPKEGDTAGYAANTVSSNRPARSSKLSADFKDQLLTISSKEEQQQQKSATNRIKGGSPERNSPNNENRKEHRSREISTRKDEERSHRQHSKSSRSDSSKNRRTSTTRATGGERGSTRKEAGHDEASQSPQRRRSPTKQRKKSENSSPTQEDSQRRHHRRSGKHSSSRSPKRENESKKTAEKRADETDEEPAADVAIISAEIPKETTQEAPFVPLTDNSTTIISPQNRADPNEKSFGGFTAQLKTDEERQQSSQPRPQPSSSSSSSRTNAAAATATPRVSRLGSHRSRSGRNLMGGSFRGEETTGRLLRPVVRHHKSMDRRTSSDGVQNASMLSRNDSVTSRRNKDSSSGTPRRLFERSLSSEQLLVRATSEQAATVTASTNGRGSSSGRKSLRRNHSGLETGLVQRVVRPSSPSAGLQW